MNTAAATERPAFLAKRHEAPIASGEAIVSDFRKLSKADAVAVDKWLLWASVYGSMTNQEDHLFHWINETDPSFDDVGG